MANVNAFSALFCLLILIYASQSDIRKRSVSNVPWLVMIMAGSGLLAYQTVSTGISVLLQSAVSVASTMAVSYLFFRLRLFGGADAKCLIAIAVLFPAQPSFAILSQRFPVFPAAAAEVFPFALTSLINAALLALVVPVSLSFRNLFALGFRGFCRNLSLVFIGYETPISQLVRNKHIKLAHSYESKGSEVRRTFAFAGEEIDEEMVGRLESYHKNGKLGSKVWVTPDLPFVVFITFGFVVSLLLGNLLLAVSVL